MVLNKIINRLREKGNNKKTIILMCCILLIVMILGSAIGAVYVPFFDTVKIILTKWGVMKSTAFNRGAESIIYYVRFPRVLVAALVGSALATSGAVMQGMFRNPMADPGIIGVSSGASLGAITAISLGMSTRTIYALPAFAVVGAFIAATIIYRLSVKRGKIPVLTLILSGIAVSTFIGAINSLILTSLNEYEVREYIFWTIGGLGSRRWEHVFLVVIPIIVCVIILITYSRDLNVMLLGEEEAHSVGLNPMKTRKILLFLTSVTTAMAVCVSGNIAFVGLIVPHILRLIVGPDHRILLPASAVGGAIFLVTCDIIARTVIMPAEIGVGIVTSLMGAPYFLFLLNKARKEGVAF